MDFVPQLACCQGIFEALIFALALDAGEDVFDPIGAIDEKRSKHSRSKSCQLDGDGRGRERTLVIGQTEIQRFRACETEPTGAPYISQIAAVCSLSVLKQRYKPPIATAKLEATYPLAEPAAIRLSAMDAM